MRWTLWQGRSFTPQALRRPGLVPLSIHQAVGVLDGERVLAQAQLVSGGWAIATKFAVILNEGATDGVSDQSSVLRRWWHEVAEATWDPVGARVVARWADGGVVTISLTNPVGDFPQVVRERVMSTQVVSQRLSVRGRRGVTVAIRRHAGDGSMFIQEVPDEGLGDLHPEVVDHIAAVASGLAEQVGLRLP